MGAGGLCVGGDGAGKERANHRGTKTCPTEQAGEQKGQTGFYETLPEVFFIYIAQKKNPEKCRWTKTPSRSRRIPKSGGFNVHFYFCFYQKMLRLFCRWVCGLCSESNHKQTFCLAWKQFPIILKISDLLPVPHRGWFRFQPSSVFNPRVCFPGMESHTPGDMARASVPEIEWSVLCKKLPEIKPTGTHHAGLNRHVGWAGTTGEGPATFLSISQRRGVTSRTSQRTNEMPIF